MNKIKFLIFSIFLILFVSGCKPTDNNPIVSIPNLELSGTTLQINVDNGSNIYTETIIFGYDGYALIIDENNEYYLSKWYFNIYNDVVVENIYYIDVDNSLIIIDNPQIQTFEFGNILETDVYYTMYTNDSYYGVSIVDIYNSSLDNLTYIDDEILLIDSIDTSLYTTDDFFDFISVYYSARLVSSLTSINEDTNSSSSLSLPSSDRKGLKIFKR